MADASFADVMDRYEGELDESRTLQQIDDASVVLRILIPDLDARLADGRTTAAAVRIVVVRMVLRVLRNPDGFKNEQAGDYGYSRDAAVASGLLSVTDADKALLGIRTANRRGTIRVGSSFRATYP